MTAKDFMVGDWASINEKHPDCPFTRQLDIGDLSFFTKFEPIPITKEVLQANGFYYRKEDDSYHLSLGFLGDNYCRSGIEVFFTDIVATIRVECNHVGYTNRVQLNAKYIHELQRVLRVCGLYDFANNLKIQ